MKERTKHKLFTKVLIVVMVAVITMSAAKAQQFILQPYYGYDTSWGTWYSNIPMPNKEISAVIRLYNKDAASSQLPFTIDLSTDALNAFGSTVGINQVLVSDSTVFVSFAVLFCLFLYLFVIIYAT